MTASFKETNKIAKMNRYLDTVKKEEIESSNLSKTFCLTNAVAAGKFVDMHGGFRKMGSGTWRKE